MEEDPPEKVFNGGGEEFSSVPIERAAVEC